MAKHSSVLCRQGKLSFAECPASASGQPDSAVQPQARPAKPKISLQDSAGIWGLPCNPWLLRVPGSPRLSQGQPARVGQGCLPHICACQKPAGSRVCG